MNTMICEHCGTEKDMFFLKEGQNLLCRGIKSAEQLTQKVLSW